MKKIICLTVLIFLVLTGTALAYQPRIVFNKTTIKIEEPETSKAYYDILSGDPVVYQIEADESFDLYINLLVPAIENTRKDFIIEIRKDGVLLDMLQGGGDEWTNFYEPYGRDNYLRGPEFKQEAEPGSYEIEIFNNDYDGKYVLVIGEKEEFPLKRIIKTALVLPKIKVQFFGKSPLVALFNLSGLFLLVIILLILTIIFVLKKILKKRKEIKNEI